MQENFERLEIQNLYAYITSVLDCDNFKQSLLYCTECTNIYFCFHIVRIAAGV
jgi:hypothetical protein